ncbi:hypothetical protein CH352_14795 [Leptospira hartskeerlii]|uniref:Uncharacterized protein n=1 Tax=Leptospira hartskeerlii TaxID=2023177 RepID=A0A2M9XCK5_9LEPT|nr:hypothetical protein [Leptospira hartskeerlii]PJZ25420.1 hypothetical protein CH357_10890 [Leptospira hartskeerlii]PJZ32600.1 hypothetical protein CH352_14795 [Leptospira hartskeerlii]
MGSLGFHYERMLIRFLIIWSFASGSFCGPIGPNYNYWDIESFDSTYLRFNFPDLGPESQYFPPGLFVSERDKKTYYLTIFLENDWLPNRSLQPEEWYWKKFYSNWESLPPIVKSDPRFNYISGCEYYIPVPVGKYNYSIFSYNRNRSNIGSGSMTKFVELQPGQSARIHFRNPETLTEEKIDPNKYIKYTKGDRILFSIESSPLQMDKPGCEFVK